MLQISIATILRLCNFLRELATLTNVEKAEFGHFAILPTTAIDKCQQSSLVLHRSLVSHWLSEVEAHFVETITKLDVQNCTDADNLDTNKAKLYIALKCLNRPRVTLHLFVKTF